MDGFAVRHILSLMWYMRDTFSNSQGRAVVPSSRLQFRGMSKLYACRICQYPSCPPRCTTHISWDSLEWASHNPAQRS
jgi:hypothetical protein